MPCKPSRLLAAVPLLRGAPRKPEGCLDLDDSDAIEQYQQRGRGRRPQCRSAAIAGDGRLDALADPRLAGKRLADPRRDH